LKSKESKVWRIRDAVHNIIEFDGLDPLESRLWEVIQTPFFQRLRRIRQLGFSEFVYPGATHTRFAHSLGVFHTARRLVAVIRKFEERSGERYEDQHAAPALAAALLHDVGHGMFSHAFEAVGKEFGWAMAKHEDVSQALIREGEIADILNDYYMGFADNVAEILKDNKDKQIPPNIFHAVISSQFDADRLDYMQRDRLMTGVRSSYVDMEWLLANLEVGNVLIEQDGEPLGTAQTLVLGSKAQHTAESYIFSLFHLYPNVYLHKTTRGFEMLFQALMRRLVCLVRADKIGDTGLIEQNPLIMFIKEPDKQEHVLGLDDNVLWSSLPFLVQTKDKYVKKCALDLAKRQPLRAIDIRLKVEAALEHKKQGNDSEEGRQLVDIICKNIVEKIRVEQRGNSEHCVLCDSYNRFVYKKAVDEKNAHLNQILIRKNGSIRDLRDVSPAIRYAENYEICRAYVFRDDGEQKNTEEVENIIAKEVKNA